MLGLYCINIFDIAFLDTKGLWKLFVFLRVKTVNQTEENCSGLFEIWKKQCDAKILDHLDQICSVHFHKISEKA